MIRQLKFAFLFAFTLLFLLSAGIAKADTPKLYLITTASSGFGTAISDTLAKEGHSLILAGRDEKKLNLLKTTLESKYKGHYTIELFDYGNDESIKKLGTQLKKYNIHGIVLMPPRIKINTTELPSSNEWTELFNQGFIAPMELIKHTIPVLQPEGSIVIISGLSSVNYLPEYKNTNVLRKMWIAESKNLVYQFEHKRVRVNCLSPNVILTEFHNNKIQERANRNNKSVADQLHDETASIPLHRYGRPQDIAEATAFLLSNKSSYINGTNIVIDGGFNKSY